MTYASCPECTNLVEYDLCISPKKHEIKQLASDIGLSCLLVPDFFNSLGMAQQLKVGFGKLKVPYCRGQKPTAQLVK